MDTVYGTKKYFQNLRRGDNDYYRHSTGTVMTNYSSYQNSLHRTTAGPYSHINKLSYPSEYNFNNPYAYNNVCGIWRDTRNLTPSISQSSSKSRSSKSFSVLLITAAFIVILAVLCVAGLAFYFSTFKSDPDDSIMIFDGKFRVTRGDVFTAGLKYNHTSVYRQKLEFYQNLINYSLENNGLSVYRCEINGFGDGPLINVHFRVFLDMRRVPKSIKIVEEHIKESILKETNLTPSNYKAIHIEPISIEIKRLLDHEVLRSASFLRDSVQSTTSPTTTDEEKSKPSTIDKTMFTINPNILPKIKANTTSIIDTENAPVVHGSFEVTKTDADITQKRYYPSTLKPFTITNMSMRVKSKPIIEKLKFTPSMETSIMESAKPTTEKNIVTTKNSHTAKITTNASSTIGKIELPIGTTIMSRIVTAELSDNITSTASTTTATTTTTTTTIPITTPSTTTQHQDLNILDLIEQTTVASIHPKLDSNLFTSSPIIDFEPWHPIQPTDPTVKQLYPTIRRSDEIPQNPLKDYDQKILDFNVLPRNKIRFSDYITENPSYQLFYQSYSNPAFTYSTKGIEKLGVGYIKPFPLPVNKINEDELLPDSLPAKFDVIDMNMDKNKFEYLGDGVIVKKLELLENSDNQTTTTITSTLSTILSNETTTTDKSNIINNNSNNDSSLIESTYIKTKDQEHDPNKYLNNITSEIQDDFLTHPINSSVTNESIKRYNTLANKGDLSSKETDTVWEQPLLFPVQSKWELINASSNLSANGNQAMRKKFNETLQAWIIENSQNDFPVQNSEFHSLKDKRINNNTELVRNISSIFDTLSSKLGITDNGPHKFPIISPPVVHKINASSVSTTPKTVNNPNAKLTTTTKSATLPRSSSTTTGSVSDRISNNILTTSIPKLSLEESFSNYNQKKIISVPSITNDNSDTILGAAEIEEVDPTQYEDILSLENISSLSTVSEISTQQPQKLITLMPVRSNSGLRPNIFKENPASIGRNFRHNFHKYLQ